VQESGGRGGYGGRSSSGGVPERGSGLYIPSDYPAIGLKQ
jgi:hypothetical protein